MRSSSGRCAFNCVDGSILTDGLIKAANPHLYVYTPSFPIQGAASDGEMREEERVKDLMRRVYQERASETERERARARARERERDIHHIPLNATAIPLRITSTITPATMVITPLMLFGTCSSTLSLAVPALPACAQLAHCIFDGLVYAHFHRVVGDQVIASKALFFLFAEDVTMVVFRLSKSCSLPCLVPQP
jgi:hypothetical protein